MFLKPYDEQTPTPLLSEVFERALYQKPLPGMGQNDDRRWSSTEVEGSGTDRWGWCFRTGSTAADSTRFDARTRRRRRRGCRSPRLQPIRPRHTPSRGPRRSPSARRGRPSVIVGVLLTPGREHRPDRNSYRTINPAGDVAVGLRHVTGPDHEPSFAANMPDIGITMLVSAGFIGIVRPYVLADSYRRTNVWYSPIILSLLRFDDSTASISVWFGSNNSLGTWEIYTIVIGSPPNTDG